MTLSPGDVVFCLAVAFGMGFMTCAGFRLVLLAAEVVAEYGPDFAAERSPRNSSTSSSTGA